MWSCGDINHDLTGFTHNSLIRNTITNETSTNGSYCLKLSPVNDYAITRIPFPFENGGKYQLKLKAYNMGIPNARINIVDSSGNIHYTLLIPASTGFREYSIEFISSHGEERIIFWTYNDANNNLFIDDIQLTAQ